MLSFSLAGRLRQRACSRRKGGVERLRSRKERAESIHSGALNGQSALPDNPCASRPTQRVFARPYAIWRRSSPLFVLRRQWLDLNWGSTVKTLLVRAVGAVPLLKADTRWVQGGSMMNGGYWGGGWMGGYGGAWMLLFDGRARGRGDGPDHLDHERKRQVDPPAGRRALTRRPGLSHLLASHRWVISGRPSAVPPAPATLPPFP